MLPVFLARPMVLPVAELYMLGRSHCHTLTSSRTKLEKSLSFQDIFTKNGGNLGPGIYHRLVKMIFKVVVCMTVS